MNHLWLFGDSFFSRGLTRMDADMATGGGALVEEFAKLRMPENCVSTEERKATM